MRFFLTIFACSLFSFVIGNSFLSESALLPSSTVPKPPAPNQCPPCLTCEAIGQTYDGTADPTSCAGPASNGQNCIGQANVLDPILVNASGRDALTRITVVCTGTINCMICYFILDVINCQA